MTTYYRINVEDISENVIQYNSLKELLNETTYFYHQTFADEGNYNENKEYTNLQEALELWEGNGYTIAEELNTGIITDSYKFEIFEEKGTVVKVQYDFYKLLETEDYLSVPTNKHYHTKRIQSLLQDEELTKEEKKLLQDCIMLLDKRIVDFIQFEEL